MLYRNPQQLFGESAARELLTKVKFDFAVKIRLKIEELVGLPTKLQTCGMKLVTKPTKYTK